VQIAKKVDATMFPLDEAPECYQAFDQSAAKKCILDPHRTVA
jgi:glutathione-independent formaldehyde dehydrogenase